MNAQEARIETKKAEKVRIEWSKLQADVIYNEVCKKILEAARNGSYQVDFVIGGLDRFSETRKILMDRLNSEGYSVYPFETKLKFAFETRAAAISIDWRFKP